MPDLKKRPDENERQYLWRIGQYIKSGVVENWKSVTPTINAECRSDESEYRDESAYRKPVQYAQAFYEDVFSKMVGGEEYYEELQKQKDEIYKLKKQYFDQRREYNKLLTLEARAEHLFDTLEHSAMELNRTRPLQFTEVHVVSDKEAVVVFADWHYGMVTDNIWNKYNTDICRERVEYVVSKMKSQLALHKPKRLHVLLLGDSCHGAIHTTSRVSAEEDTCDQIMQVSELFAQAIDELSKETEETNVYSSYGNHLRTVQNKKESVHSDNMEKLIPWWLAQRFKDRKDVNIIGSEYRDIIKLNVCGYTICATHGDLDSFSKIGISLNTLFTKKYNESIDYTISADKHHLEEFERFDIESILVRSLCGTDDYGDSKRLYSSAGQTLIVFNEEDGRECTYNIKIKN